MNRERGSARSTGVNAGAALFAILVIVSMFLTYVTVNLILTKTETTGFKLLDYEGSSGNPFLIISIILSICIAAFAFLRLIRFPLFNTKLFSIIFALAGVALMVVSIVLMIKVVDVKVGNNTYEIADRGIGVILNLVFSVMTAMCCIGSFTATDKS